MASIEVNTANGAEDMSNDIVSEVTGKPAQRFDDWVQEHKSAWA